MKLYRNLIILVAVLVVLLGAYIIFDRVIKTDTTDDISSKQIELYKFDTENVAELTVENTDGKYVFKKDGTEWSIISGGNFEIDTTNVNAVVANAADLNAYKLVEENSTSLEKYGLDKPYRATIKMTDGTEKVLEVGDMTPTKEAYYIKKGDSNNVYTVYAYIGDLLVVDKAEIRKKYFYDVDSVDIVRFVLNRNGKTVFDAEKTEESGWTLHEPVKGNANLVRVSTILESFVRASVAQYVEENPQDLSKYGLDNPAYVIESATDKLKVKLFLGKMTDSKEDYYGMLEGSNEVITINSSSLSFVDIKPIEVCENLVYAPTIYDVSEVVVNIDGTTRTIQIESDSAKPEEDKFTADGIDVISKGDDAKTAFRNYYRALVGIIYEDIEKLDEKPTGTPEITITYNMKKAPGKMVVEFIPKDERNYYVLRNGEYDGMVVKKKVFDEADGPRKNYDKLMGLLKK